jgi:hypothetical protein
VSARDPDDLLRDGGGEIGDLYRRLPRYEPPRRLDRAVLNEAARAVHSGRPPRRQRWVVGIGSAAGLVLAAGIAWRIGHEPIGQNETMSPAAAPRVVPVQPITESARVRHDESAQRAAAPADADAARAQESRAAGAPGDSAAVDQVKSAPRKVRAASKLAPAEVPKAPPPAPAAARPPEAFPSTASEPEAKDLEKSEGFSAGMAAPAQDHAASADKRAATTNLRGRASPTVPSGSVELQRDMQLAPSEWLGRIRNLMQEGRRQQATESLRLFVRTHPDRHVPDDLRELLE